MDAIMCTVQKTFVFPRQLCGVWSQVLLTMNISEYWTNFRVTVTGSDISEYYEPSKLFFLLNITVMDHTSSKNDCCSVLLNLMFKFLKIYSSNNVLFWPVTEK